MSKYKFTAEDQDLLAVAKHNQNLSEKISEKNEQLKAHMTAENDKHEQFLNAVESKLGVQPPVRTPHAIIRPKPTVQDWQELVNEAREDGIYEVDFEDLLTSEEFANAYRHLDEINAVFAKKTAFRKVDWIFLMTAIALQCARQYVIDPWIKSKRTKAGPDDEKKRKKDDDFDLEKKDDALDPGKKDDFDLRYFGDYYVRTEDIFTKPVPFDAQKFSSTSPLRGFLKGGDHRRMTLGHDPLLGWLFGTANILTKTLTRVDLISAHIKFEKGKGDVIHSPADTLKVFSACGERFNEGWDGKLAIGCAVVREAIHLKSDVFTKDSLPIPFVHSNSPELGRELAKHGVDIASVGTEAGLSMLINTLISMIHRFFYDESVDDKKLYEVRTRKIILYSNCIASISNVIIAAIAKNPKLLDFGGMLVTISRLFSDIRFICRIKQEFIQSELDIHFQGIVDEIEAMYSSSDNIFLA